MAILSTREVRRIKENAQCRRSKTKRQKAQPERTEYSLSIFNNRLTSDGWVAK